MATNPLPAGYYISHLEMRVHVAQVARKYVRDEADGHELTFLPLHRSSPDGVQDPLRFAFLCFKTMLPQVSLFVENDSEAPNLPGSNPAWDLSLGLCNRLPLHPLRSCVTLLIPSLNSKPFNPFFRARSFWSRTRPTSTSAAAAAPTPWPTPSFTSCDRAGRP